MPRDRIKCRLARCQIGISVAQTSPGMEHGQSAIGSLKSQGGTALWQLREETAVARLGFADVEALVDLPSLADGRMHDGDAKILLEQLDDPHRLPAAALDIDTVGVAMPAIELLDVGVERLDRNLRH